MHQLTDLEKEIYGSFGCGEESDSSCQTTSSDRFCKIVDDDSSSSTESTTHSEHAPVNLHCVRNILDETEQSFARVDKQNDTKTTEALSDQIRRDSYRQNGVSATTSGTEKINSLPPPKHDTPTLSSTTMDAILSPVRQLRIRTSHDSKRRSCNFHSSDSALAAWINTSDFRRSPRYLQVSESGAEVDSPRSKVDTHQSDSALLKSTGEGGLRTRRAETKHINFGNLEIDSSPSAKSPRKKKTSRFLAQLGKGKNEEPHDESRKSRIAIPSDLYIETLACSVRGSEIVAKHPGVVSQPVHRESKSKLSPLTSMFLDSLTNSPCKEKQEVRIERVQTEKVLSLKECLLLAAGTEDADISSTTASRRMSSFPCPRQQLKTKQAQLSWNEQTRKIGDTTLLPINEPKVRKVVKIKRIKGDKTYFDADQL